MPEMPDKKVNPPKNPPVPDIQSMGSATEYTGLVPAMGSPDCLENELVPFHMTQPAFPYAPSDGDKPASPQP